MVPNKQFLLIWKRNWGQINDFGWGGGGGGGGGEGGGGDRYKNLFMCFKFLMFINTKISKGCKCLWDQIYGSK